MWLAFAVSCSTAPDRDGPTASDPAPAPVPEEACSGVDEDGDGSPGSEDRCVREAPDVILEAPPLGSGCCVRWAVVPDADGDARDDVLIELQYDFGRSGTEPTAWLVSATTSGRADLLAFGSFTFGAAYEGVEDPPIVGEFDGAPGTDLWVRRHLFGDVSGSIHGDEAIADVVDLPEVVGAADFDLDGVDDLLLRGSFRTGTYHSGGYDDWSEAYLAWGPFSGAVAEGDTLDDRVGGAVTPFDVDGSGGPEIGIDQGTWDAPGPFTVLRPDGVEVARFDEPVSPTLDLDGDGFDDAFYATYDDDRVVTLAYAGPFGGTIDPETHPVIASWEAHVFAIDDLDADGLPEIARADYRDGLEILRDASGPQGPFDPVTQGRFHQPAIEDVLPSGGPFVGEFGDEPLADLGRGVSGPGGEEHAFYVFFEPLY